MRSWRLFRKIFDLHDLVSATYEAMIKSIIFVGHILLVFFFTICNLKVPVCLQVVLENHNGGNAPALFPCEPSALER